MTSVKKFIKFSSSILGFNIITFVFFAAHSSVKAQITRTFTDCRLNELCPNYQRKVISSKPLQGCFLSDYQVIHLYLLREVLGQPNAKLFFIFAKNKVIMII